MSRAEYVWLQFGQKVPILPSNQSPLGARPHRFRQTRTLIVGCGDVGLRVLPHLRSRVLVLTSSPARAPGLRALGATPLVGNLDNPRSLRRLAGLAHQVLHLAPPPTTPPSLAHDPRTRALVQAVRRRTPPTAWVYGSTTGVYGDLKGDVATETVAANASNTRAKRRLDAENQQRLLGRAAGVRVIILRIPGIYALNREGGTPRERLQKGTPVLCAQDDVYTNHIHADDLARACLAALYRGKRQRIYNVNDDTVLKMGDYFDTAAAILGLPAPPRIPRAQAQEQLGEMMLSFMSESRRMSNARMKRELRLALRYATVVEGLRTG